MHANIIRQDGRLILKDLSCECPLTHQTPEMDIYIRPGLVNECGACIREASLPDHVLIIADSNTLEVAARAVKANLEKELERVDSKLNNENFVKKAPEKVVEEERAKKAKYADMYAKVIERLERLTS